jgi:tetratricopeptide (TPR) repeat protein
MDLTIEQALQRAVEAHKVGKLQKAEAMYKAILQKQPKHPHANHNLGVMAVSLNKTKAAIPLFKIALESNPNQGQFWLSYIDALIKEKLFEDAKKLLEQGKKRGLAGDKVDVLEEKLTEIILEQNTKLTSKNKIQTFKDKSKIVSKKKEKKKNLPSNFINLNLTKSPTEIELNTLLKHYKKGRYELAQTLAKTLTEHYPTHPFGWKVLGALLKQTGQLNDALIANQKTLEISPNDAEAHSNLGVTLQELACLEDAQASHQKAIAIKPDYAEAHYNLGITLQELGRLEDAEASYKKAIAIKYDYAEAHYNLGITLKELGRLADAETSYKIAIAIKPDYAEAHSNLGVTLQELGRLADAEASYKKALMIKPDLAEAHYNLGNRLKELGRLEDALVTATKSIQIKSTAEAKNLFVLLIKEISIKTWNQSLVEFVIEALLEPWGRPSYVMPTACRLLKTNKEFLQILKESENDIYQTNHDENFLDSISKKEFDASTLLRAILSSSAIPDAEIEIFLTSLRRHFLNMADSVTLKDGKTAEIPALFFSLAEQCFINEYVFFQTQEEIIRSQHLRDCLTKAFEDKQTVPEEWLIAVACYFPLYSIADVKILHQQKWSDDVKSVLKQQIQEPVEELNLRASISILTSIDNQVSLAVQSQYEENPYPRWVRLPKDSNKKSLNSYIQSKFSSSLFNRLLDDRNPEILIAGCGTGQHSIGTAQEMVILPFCKGARSRNVMQPWPVSASV